MAYSTMRLYTHSASTARNHSTSRCPLTGPFRYDFLVGSLKGHAYPTTLVLVEKISFRPTDNPEFGFERTVIWAARSTSRSICILSAEFLQPFRL